MNTFILASIGILAATVIYLVITQSKQDSIIKDLQASEKEMYNRIHVRFDARIYSLESNLKELYEKTHLGQQRDSKGRFL